MTPQIIQFDKIKFCLENNIKYIKTDQILFVNGIIIVNAKIEITENVLIVSGHSDFQLINKDFQNQVVRKFDTI